MPKRGANGSSLIGRGEDQQFVGLWRAPLPPSCGGAAGAQVSRLISLSSKPLLIDWLAPNDRRSTMSTTTLIVIILILLLLGGGGYGYRAGWGGGPVGGIGLLVVVLIVLLLLGVI